MFHGVLATTIYGRLARLLFRNSQQRLIRALNVYTLRTVFRSVTNLLRTEWCPFWEVFAQIFEKKVSAIRLRPCRSSLCSQGTAGTSFSGRQPDQFAVRLVPRPGRFAVIHFYVHNNVKSWMNSKNALPHGPHFIKRCKIKGEGLQRGRQRSSHVVCGCPRFQSSFPQVSWPMKSRLVENQPIRSKHIWLRAWLLSRRSAERKFSAASTFLWAMGDSTCISARCARLNQVFSGKYVSKKASRCFTREALIDAFLALYEQCSEGSMRSNKHIASFVQKCKYIAFNLLLLPSCSGLYVNFISRLHLSGHATANGRIHQEVFLSVSVRNAGEWKSSYWKSVCSFFQR